MQEPATVRQVYVIVLMDLEEPRVSDFCVQEKSTSAADTVFAKTFAK